MAERLGRTQYVGVGFDTWERRDVLYSSLQQAFYVRMKQLANELEQSGKL